MSELSNIVVDVIEDKGKLKALLPADRISLGGPQRKADITQASYDDTALAGGSQWAPWGCADFFPSDIRQQIEKVPMAGAAIHKLVGMMYGNGLIYYKDSDLLDGNTTVKRAIVPEVQDFIKRNRIPFFLMAQFADYRYYMNTFSEIIFNRRGDKVTNIYHKTAEFCRLSLQNKRSLNIENLFFSPRFAMGWRPTKEQYKTIPLYRWYDEETFLARLRRRKMAWHSHFPTPGITYYARPFWIGLAKEGGWLEVAGNVPRIVSAMQLNQISLKYQILIPESYFMVRHGEWEQYDFEKREKIINAKIDEINGLLQGVDNVFKSVSSVFKEDPITHEPFGKIEIVAVDDKAKTGTWVPDSKAADAQIVQGLGLHPSQIGLAPEGGKMGAGSGSDQRESFNTGITLNTMDQELILEPLNWISKFNGWGITFLIDHVFHTTTNLQESGLQPGEMSLQVEK